MKKTSLKKVIGVLSLSVLLAGCSDIVARPGNYNDKLLDELTHNINNDLSKIFDSYRNGSTSKSDVLDEVLLIIAENQFGKYDQADAALKDVIEQRGREKLFAEISSGTYIDTNTSIFDEKKYVIKQVYQAANSRIKIGEKELTLKELNASTDSDSLFYKEGRFLPTINKDNFTETGAGKQNLVHIEYYTPYIEKNFVPEIYRELLVEKYVKEEQKTNLGRNYARDVKYLAIKESTDFPGAAKKLLTTYINSFVRTGDANVDLEVVASAWRGYTADFFGNEAALLAQAAIENQTLFAKVESDYAKITATNGHITYPDLYNEFTNNNAHSPQRGKDLKDNTVRHTDLVTDEWAIKNGGLSSLPAAIRDRLFNIGVANGVDSVLDDKGLIADAGKIEDNKNANTFVRNIHGKYYLVPKIYEKNDESNFLFYVDGTFYIVEIADAVNTAKLTEGNKAEYSAEKKVEIIDNVAREIAELDVSRTNSIKHYFEDLDLVFHDTDIKDYFVEQFPEIFDNN